MARSQSESLVARYCARRVHHGGDPQDAEGDLRRRRGPGDHRGAPPRARDHERARHGLWQSVGSPALVPRAGAAGDRRAGGLRHRAGRSLPRGAHRGAGPRQHDRVWIAPTAARGPGRAAVRGADVLRGAAGDRVGRGRSAAATDLRPRCRGLLPPAGLGEVRGPRPVGRARAVEPLLRGGQPAEVIQPAPA